MISPNSNPLAQYASRRDSGPNVFSTRRRSVSPGSSDFNDLTRSYRKRDSTLNRYLMICLAIFVLLFLIYLWFLFRVYPISSGTRTSELPSGQTDQYSYEEHEHHHHHTHGGRRVSPIATELLELTRLHNFTSLQDKREFLEHEFNSRLAKYNGSIEDLEPFYTKTRASLNPNLTEFSNLYTMFIKKYNDFLKASADSKCKNIVL